MTDLKARLKGIEDVRAPDLWPRIERQRETFGHRPAGKRVAAAAVALLVAAAGTAYPVYLLLHRGGTQTPTAPPGPRGNGLIAFTRPTASGEVIYVVRPDGSGMERLPLAGGQGSNFGRLAWSPDGRKLAIGVQSFLRSTIEIVNEDGSGLRDIFPPCFTNGSPCAWGPAWSPDGARIAYLGGIDARVDGQAIFVINANGRGRHLLLRCAPPTCREFDGPPAWSPDGKFLAVGITEPDLSGGIYLLRADGTDLHRITHCISKLCLAGVRDQDPAWSPMGAEIVFSRERNLYAVHPNGFGLRKLTDCPAADHFISCTADTPAWAPDGTRIAFTLAQGAIFLINADGTGMHRLTPSPSGLGEGDCCPAWQAVDMARRPH